MNLIWISMIVTHSKGTGFVAGKDSISDN